MTFVPQNFKDGIGSVISAAFLNGLDVTANFVLNGAQTVPEARAALGITSDPVSPNGVGIVINGGADTGTVNEYVIPVPTGTMGTPPALAAGQILVLTAANSNNGPSTINAGGTGATAVVGQFGGALVGGEIVNTDITTVRFNGTNWQIINQSSPFTRTPAEIAAGVTPSNYSYPPGSPRRFGAVGNGTNDDTTAVQNAINTSTTFEGYPGDIYGVTTVTFPSGGPNIIRLNGSKFRGIGAGNTTGEIPAAVIFEFNFTNVYDYSIDLVGINGNPTPNPAYACATWWSNANNGSQFNNIFGCLHESCQRGMVYGVLPGTTALQTTQSENMIYGWRTNGVSNPFFQNSAQGFVHFSEPIFFRDSSTWTTATLPVGQVPLPSTARCLENEVGFLRAQGGEMIFSSSVVGFGCDLQGCDLHGMYWEGAPPVNIVGDQVQIVGGVYLNTQSNTSAFQIASGVTGSLRISDMLLEREEGAGATDMQAMINATAANASFTTVLSNTRSEEWPWSLVGNNIRLVVGGVSVYKNHRLHITATDPNIYNLNTPVDSMLTDNIFDRLAYTAGLTGWELATSASGTTMSQAGLPGPPGYNPFEVHLHATGQAIASSSGGAAVQVRPGELYWISAWVQISSGATGNTQFGVDLFGGTPSFIPVADATSIGAGVWTFVEGPVAVPSGNSNTFMSIGLQCTGTADMFVTDVRVRRAS